MHGLKYCRIKDSPTSEFFDINCVVWTVCNQKCPYCYIRENFPQLTGKIWTKTHTDIILKIIQNYTKHKIRIEITGGEPTLWPYLNYFIERLDELSNVASIELVTNASKDLKKTFNSEKLAFTISYHPSSTKNLNKFKDNLEYAQSINKLNCVVIMLENGHFKECNTMIEHCKQQNYNFNTEYIMTSNRENDFDVDVSEYNDEMFFYDGKTVSTTDIFEQKLNRFKDYMCLINGVTIYTDGSIEQGCLNVNGNIFNDHELLSKLGFAVKCQRDVCDNTCWIGYHKWKNLKA